jgi:hypothetical protein
MSKNQRQDATSHIITALRRHFGEDNFETAKTMLQAGIDKDDVQSAFERWYFNVGSGDPVTAAAVILSRAMT